MARNLYLFLLFLIPVALYSQVMQTKWKYKDAFEKEFKGKYYIDEDINSILMPIEVIEMPTLSEEQIIERVISFANKRVQFGKGDTHEAHYTRSGNTIILIESSPLIKNGKYMLMDNYVRLIYSYKIDIKDEAIRLSISINNIIGTAGGWGAWPMTKYFKKNSIKTYTYFYEYAKELLNETKQYILQKENHSW
ncbi:MAG: DUF4468 domain-containing protein [Coprobacter sp.]|nr:DUF4468 domain-containing protein [Coprobacter sp.]